LPLGTGPAYTESPSVGEQVVSSFYLLPAQGAVASAKRTSACDASVPAGAKSHAQASASSQVGDPRPKPCHCIDQPYRECAGDQHGVVPGYPAPAHSRFKPNGITEGIAVGSLARRVQRYAPELKRRCRRERRLTRRQMGWDGTAQPTCHAAIQAIGSFLLMSGRITSSSADTPSRLTA
jgi:hypothetical protein